MIELKIVRLPWINEFYFEDENKHTDGNKCSIKNVHHFNNFMYKNIPYSFIDFKSNNDKKVDLEQSIQK